MDVLCEDGVIAGCVAVDRNMDPLWEGLDWSREGEPPAAVHRLMVHPSRQGRGLAKYLMHHAEAAAERALLTGACRYQSVKSILKNSLDVISTSTPPPSSPPPPHDNIRGAEYFE